MRRRARIALIALEHKVEKYRKKCREIVSCKAPELRILTRRLESNRDVDWELEEL